MDKTERLVLEWTKEAYNEFKEIRQEMGEIKDTVNGIDKNFSVFEAKVNTRTALIAGIIGTIVLISSLMINIGTIKSNLGFKKEALDLHERSLRISEEIGDKSGIAYSLGHVGNIKSDLDLKKEALVL